MGNTSSSTTTKPAVDAKTLMDCLLDAFSAERAERWDEFDRIANAVRMAEDGLDSPDYTPENRRTISDLLFRIKPPYEAKQRQYADNPDARRADSVMGLCKKYMVALDDVKADINKLGIDYERYARVVSEISLFYAQNWPHLPEDLRRNFSIKLESVRSILPGRRDYVRTVR